MTQQAHGFWEAWPHVAPVALRQAGQALGELLGETVTVDPEAAAVLPWGSWAESVQHRFPTALCTVRLQADGLTAATAWLLTLPQEAVGLLEPLLGETPTLPFDELAESALGEIGNVCGGAFLNAVADALGGAWELTPPLVVCGPAAQLLAAPQAPTVAVCAGTFRLDRTGVALTFAVVPQQA